MNWFFLEDHYYYGRRVDAFFYSIPHAMLEQRLQDVITADWYDLAAVLSPMLVPLGRDAEPHASTLGQTRVPQGDHWAVIAENPHLARFMMGRPLPTQGVQALATALQLGFKDVTLVGVDMYSSAERRYGHVVPDAVAAALDLKDITPGYENQHSLDRDLEFLDTCLAQFPDADVKYVGPSEHLHARLATPTAGEPATFAGVPGPQLAARPKPTLQATAPRDTSGPLTITESSALPHKVINGRRCGYVTMISGPTFHHGARALARSLRSTTDVPLLVMCTPSANTGALKASGIATLNVPEIMNPSILQAHTLRFSSTFTKLHAFRLDHLDRLVFLDSDMIVRQNLDELFETSGFAAVPDHGLEYHHERFNSGLFAVDPSIELFDRLMEQVRTTISYDGGDQGFLNEMFPDWVRLPHEFNVNKRWSTQHPQSFNLAHTRVLHYVGVKPWQPDVSGEFDDLHQLWFAQLSAEELADLAASLRAAAGLAEQKSEGRSGYRGVFRRQPPIQPTGSLLRRAEAFVAAGQPEHAVAALADEWPGESASPGLHAVRVKALLLAGDLESAYDALEEAGNRYPEDAPLQQIQRRVGPALRALGWSRRLVPAGAVRGASRLYSKIR